MANGYEVIHGTMEINSTILNPVQSVQVWVPEGKKALGVGASVPSDEDPDVFWVLTHLQPTIADGVVIAWTAQVRRFGPPPTTLGSINVWVTCNDNEVQ